MNNWSREGFQIAVLEDVETEPVTLAEVKAFSHIDADYTAQDPSLLIMLAAAREKLEGYTNTFFGVKKAEVWFQGGRLKLPYGPTQEIISVTKNGTDLLTTDDYTLSGFTYKQIITDGGDCGVTSWFYPIYGGWPLPWTWTAGDPTFYNVVYNTGYVVLPAVLKQAVLMLTDYLIKEQGATDMELPPAILAIANRFSQNLVIQ